MNKWVCGTGGSTEVRTRATEGGASPISVRCGVDRTDSAKPPSVARCRALGPTGRARNPERE
jgi:hypothetical protein